MKRILIVKRSSIIIVVTLVLTLLFSGSYLYHNGGNLAVFQSKSTNQKEFTLITTEFKSKTDDGRNLEVYRFDPGTIVVHQGDHVTLKFIGIQGNLHPFEIKGLGIKGEVKKGKETQVSFIASEKGTYPIVCTIHTSLASNGPMIGYLVVD